MSEPDDSTKPALPEPALLTLADLRLRRSPVRAGSRRATKASAAPMASLFGDSATAESVASRRAPISSALPSAALPLAPPQPPARSRDAAPAPQATRVWTVASLVRRVRGMVEESFADQLTVEGEISNWRPAGSGHCYFTLKGGDAQLSTVMFRTPAMRLSFKPKDGDAVRLRGQLSVYENRGQMQIVAASMELAGMGAQLAAVQELKARLRAEGLFDRKRPLPAFPRCIGVITSAQGAALRDIVKVCRRRHAAVNLLVYPAAVQGPRCPAEIIAGLRWFLAHPERVDVVLIARGGGSWEDLHGFDDEGVVRAIAGCALPVVSGIGHATDSTLADSAADVCAPTPSAAAELVTAAQHRVEEHVARFHARVLRAGGFELLRARQRLLRLGSEVALRRVRESLTQRSQRLDELGFQLEAATGQALRSRTERWRGMEARLQARHISRQLPELSQRHDRLRSRLQTAGTAALVRDRVRAAAAASKLGALSPLRVLERGYALVYEENGALLRDAQDTATGRTISARLAKGSLRARVETANA